MKLVLHRTSWDATLISKPDEYDLDKPRVGYLKSYTFIYKVFHYYISQEQFSYFYYFFSSIQEALYSGCHPLIFRTY